MMNSNVLLHEQAAVVTGLAPVTPSSSTPDYVSLKNYLRMTAVILVKNGTTVTGSAIAAVQATAVAGTGAKALALTTGYRNLDTAAAGGDALSSFAISSNTFTTLTTNSKDAIYLLDITPDMLDVANGFDCVALTAANAANTTISILYLLWPAKYGKSSVPAAITD